MREVDGRSLIRPASPSGQRDTLISHATRAHNFTNEGGAFGTVRRRKNRMGLWISKASRREWQTAGIDVDYGHLLEEVSEAEDSPGLIFPR